LAAAPALPVASPDCPVSVTPSPGFTTGLREHVSREWRPLHSGIRPLRDSDRPRDYETV